MSWFRAVRPVAAGLAVLLSGCGSSMMGTEFAAQLLTVSPRGGAVDIAPSSEIVLGFNRSMMSGMESYVALHLNAPDGPVVPMVCTWSGNRTTLTCRPDQPLAPGTRYVIHLGGGMMDAHGGQLDMNGNGMGMGGQWATGGMMGGQSGMMGTGWAFGNGTYGMVFEFTTR